MAITVALADDHPLILKGIHHLLLPLERIKVIALYNSGRELLAGLMSQQPDVLLLDINFPDIEGNELARVISGKYPKVRILALSSVDTPYQIKDMLQHGCSGYLLKNAKLETLSDAIEQVYEGKQFLEPHIKDLLLNSVMRRERDVQLTKREKEILTLVCAGDTNKEIAAKLFVNTRTVENHRFSLYSKFGVKNVAGLVKIALKNGLIE